MPYGPDTRSTLVLLDRITEIETGREVAVLVGNTSDVYVGADGAVYRLPHLLAHDAADRGYATIAYSLAGGARQLNPGSRMPPVALRYPDPGTPADTALDDLLTQLSLIDQPCRILIDYADLLLSPAGAVDTAGGSQERCIELLAEQAVTQAAGRSVHRLLVLSRAGGGLDERLTHLPGFQAVTAPLPNRAERAAMLARAQAPATGPALRLAADLDPHVFTSLTGGLSCDDIVRGREHTAASGQPLTRAWIQQRKSDTLHRMAGDTLTIYPPGDGMADVAGLPQIRLVLHEAMLTGRPPRRILLAGPPGVGKTLCVRAIADELGMPAVALGNYRNMYVGETERRLRLALQVIQDLAPCVLHIDEIDQQIGQRTTGQSTDSGTSERVLADIWAFLGDNTRAERVMVVATTNRPELLDSAMFDRFLIVPVLHPTPTEAADVLTIAARREGRTLDPAQARQAVVRYGQLVTGRVLVDVMDRALTLADLGGAQVDGHHLDQAFDDLLTALDTADHERLALRAVALTTFRSYLPWEAAQRLGETPHIPDYVRPLLNPDGRIDAARLNARLAML